ncbi:recombinase family protein [uncultured Intestinimonas sp.]|uniref:recombinase family protein n=1 Tax=uncultured Intestinimonas sp. TaxID=1689265 RepID=UPI0025DE9D99|nr:recombinase family protein [uncultured Intestinimonas sp.]
MGGERAALYCRVDGGGDPELGLSMQRRRLEELARKRGLKLAGYYEDAGYAGHDLTRPGLKQLLADWSKGKFDIVLVVKRTRLFRGRVWEEPKWPFSILSAAQLDRDPYCERKR